MKRIEQALTTRASLTLLALAAVLVGAGCRTAHEPESSGSAENFLGEGETSAVTRLADAQSAAGASTDATLRPYHFDGGELSSLGREKLDLMLADGAGKGGEFVLYLDVDDASDNGRLSTTRRDAASEYFIAQGAAERSIRIEDGPNPNNTFLATSARGEPEAVDDGGGDTFKMLGAMAEGMGASDDAMSK